MKVLKPRRIPADNATDMGAPVVTPTAIEVGPRWEATRMRRTGIWTSVVGVVLTLVGGLTVLATRDAPDGRSAVPATEQPAPDAAPEGSTATTSVSVPGVSRTTGTLAPRPRPILPGVPAVPTGPPPVTPQEVAELLAGLPLQLEQAATSDGQPRELPPEEVDKMVDDLLRQLGAQP